MNRLPFETLEHLIDFAAPTDLFNLSLTQHGLGAIAERHLYRNITVLTKVQDLDQLGWWDLSEDWAICLRRSVLAQFSLIKRPHRYHYVRTISVDGRHHRSIAIGRRAINRKATEIEDIIDPIGLVRMVNLREVYLLDLRIRPSFRHTIYTLPWLDTLHFTRCVFYTPHGLETVDPTPRGTLTKVTFRGSMESGPELTNGWASYLPQGLRTVNAMSSVNAAYVLIMLYNKKITDTLTSLSFTLANFESDRQDEALLVFFASARAVTSININPHTFSNPLPSFSLPTTALPLLESYSGPQNLAAMFIEGRPVQRVLLSLCRTRGQDFGAETLLFLRQSSAEITELGLRYGEGVRPVFFSDGPSRPRRWFEMIRSIPESAPALRKLLVGALPLPKARKPTYIKELALNVLPRLNSLVELQFDFPDTPGICLDPQRYSKHEPLARAIHRSPCAHRDQIVNACGQACPSMRMLVFGEGQGWGGCEKLESNEWAAFTWDKPYDFWKVDDVDKWRH